MNNPKKKRRILCVSASASKIAACSGTIKKLFSSADVVDLPGPDEAIVAAFGTPTDLVFFETDATMDGATSPASKFLARVKRAKPRSFGCIVVLTAGNENARLSALDAGADDVVIWPLEESHLEARALSLLTREYSSSLPFLTTPQGLGSIRLSSVIKIHSFSERVLMFATDLELIKGGLLEVEVAGLHLGLTVDTVNHLNDGEVFVRATVQKIKGADWRDLRRTVVELNATMANAARLAKATKAA